MVALKLSLQLIIMIAVGFTLVKVKVVTKDFDKPLASLMSNLLVPCLIVKSMLGQYSVDELKSAGILLLISCGTLAVMMIAGQLVYILCHRNYYGTFLRFGIPFTNFTFMGVPVMQALFGDQGVFYLMVLLIPFRIVYYLSIERFLSPKDMEKKKKTFGETMKAIFSPMMIALILALILYFIQVEVPSPIMGCISSFSACASPLGLLLCGMSIAKYDLKNLINPKFAIFPLVCNILVPAFFMGLYLLLGLPKDLSQVMVIFCTLPIGSLLAAFTVRYNPDVKAQFIAAAAVLWSTVLAAVTIPVWSLITNAVFVGA